MKQIKTLIDPSVTYAQKLVESVQEMTLHLVGVDICCCPQCGEGKLVYLKPIARSAYEDTSGSGPIGRIGRFEMDLVTKKQDSCVLNR